MNPATSEKALIVIIKVLTSGGRNKTNLDDIIKLLGKLEEVGFCIYGADSKEGIKGGIRADLSFLEELNMIKQDEKSIIITSGGLLTGSKLHLPPRVIRFLKSNDLL